MKFLMDMALSPKSVEFLKNNGYDVVRVNEVIEKIKGKPIEDIEIYEFAIKNNYTIITADLDFGEILAYSKSSSPSTIVLRIEDFQVKNVNEKLKLALPKIKDELDEGSIIIIEKHRIRIKKLPISKE